MRCLLAICVCLVVLAAATPLCQPIPPAEGKPFIAEYPRDLGNHKQQSNENWLIGGDMVNVDGISFGIDINISRTDVSGQCISPLTSAWSITMSLQDPITQSRYTSMHTVNPSQIVVNEGEFNPFSLKTGNFSFFQGFDTNEFVLDARGSLNEITVGIYRWRLFLMVVKNEVPPRSGYEHGKPANALYVEHLGLKAYVGNLRINEMNFAVTGDLHCVHTWW